MPEFHQHRLVRTQESNPTPLHAPRTPLARPSHLSRTPLAPPSHTPSLRGTRSYPTCWQFFTITDAHVCDMCRNGSRHMYRCDVCDFDACPACFNKKDKATGEGVMRGDAGVRDAPHLLHTPPLPPRGHALPSLPPLLPRGHTLLTIPCCHVACPPQLASLAATCGHARLTPLPLMPRVRCAMSSTSAVWTTCGGACALSPPTSPSSSSPSLA